MLLHGSERFPATVVSVKRQFGVQGYHACLDFCLELSCQRETTNPSDRYTVRVVRSGQVMGHLPFLGFRQLPRDMASCIDVHRSLAFDWIIDMQLEFHQLLV